MGFVQGAAGSSSVNVTAVAFTSANTGGNTLITAAMAAEPFGGFQTMAIVDTQGNTWVPFSAPPTEFNNFLPGLWICASCAAGANTVTVTYGNPADGFGYGTENVALVITEWAGLISPDAHTVGEGTSVSTVTASLTTTQSGDILVGLGLMTASGIDALTNTSGFTTEFAPLEFSGSGAIAFGVFDTVAGAPGSYSLTAKPTTTGINYGYLYLLAFTASVSLTAQTITFAGIADHAPTDAPFTLAPTSDSGLTVSLVVTSGPATISGFTVTLTGGTGTVTIEATQAGNGTYSAATPVSQSFNVAKTAQTITFAPIADHVSNDLPFTFPTPTSDSGLTVSLALTSGPATISGDVVTLTGAAGTVTIQATQAGNSTYAAATPVNQSFGVSAAQRGNIAYDQIKASDRTGNGNQLLTYSPTPAAATSPGTPGQVAFDAAGNWYFCYGVNQWGRIGPTGYGSAAASPPSW